MIVNSKLDKWYEVFRARSTGAEEKKQGKG